MKAKDYRKKEFKETIIPILKRSGLDFYEFNPGSWRIIGDENTVDYHPSGGKLFYHNEKKWDEHKGTTKHLIELLSWQFDIKSDGVTN